MSLVLEGISKRYGKLLAVSRFNLSVNDGEFVTLLGPSGCGKTTTLRIIAGFLPPDEGRVVIDGQDVSRVSPQYRNIGMVFQDYALFPHLTVQENVEFSLKERRVPKKERNQLALEFLDLVRLPLPNRYPAELSGGQRQRVALARALVFHPRILLMDEPLGALDVKLREIMQLEIKRLQRQLQITTIYVTHDQQEALTMSDRIVVMRDGEALQIGTPEDIYERPSDQFVADFIGKSNFIDGLTLDPRTVQGPGGASLRLAEDFGACPRTPVRLAVRPEFLFLGSGERAGWNCVVGIVVDRKYLGNRLQYYLRVEETTVVAEQGMDEDRYRLGEKVFIHWKPEKALVWKVNG